MDILNINKDGSLKRVDDSLFFESKEGKIIKIPIMKVNVINIYSHVNFTSDLIWFLNKYNISINFFNSFSGNYYGNFNYSKNKNNAKILYAQLKELYEKRDDKIVNLYNTMIDNMVFILKYYQKNLNYEKEITIIIKDLRFLKSVNIERDDIHEYMLFEAKVWNKYYSSFDIILKGSSFVFERRTKNPPENEVNALISFLNMKLYSLISNIMHTTQLDPRVGFLHELNGGRHSLVLDVSEIFKPLFVNKFIFNIINNKTITKKHFKDSVMLNEDGLFLLNREWSNYMKQTIFVPTLKKHCSYEYLIKLQCYKIIKYLFNINENKLYFLKYDDLFS